MKQTLELVAPNCFMRGVLPIWLAAIALAGPAHEPPPESAPSGSVLESMVPSSQPSSAPAPTDSEEASDDLQNDRNLAVRRQQSELRELSADLGFDTRFEHRAVSSENRGYYLNGRNSQTDQTLRFEESVGLHGQGSLFDDRILQYDAGARWGLRQSRFREWGSGLDLDENPSGNLLEYDARVNLFPAGKLSGNAFASQISDRLPRAFQPSLDRTRERFGGGLFFNDQTLPMRLTYEHEYDQLDSLSHRRDGLRDNEDTRRETLRYEATWQSSENHSLNLSYEYGQNTDKYSGLSTRFDTTRNYLTIDDTFRFGKDSLSRLETIARIQEESGQLGQDASEFTPKLHLQHSPTFSTDYSFQYLRQNYDQLDAEQYRGDISATHKWGDFLTSTLGVYGLDRNSAGGGWYGGGGSAIDTGEFGANANFSFSKDNALGRLSANLAYNYSTTTVDDARRSGVVIGESVTFRDPLSAWLAQRNVQIGTLVVTDVTRTRIFVPVRDYVAVQVGGYTALRRVPTGRINDRQTVLVNYAYRVFNNYSLHRNRVDFRIQQDFKFGLTPYYALSVQDEDINSRRFLTWPTRDINRHRFGLTYKQKAWSVGAEYEFNDDQVDPYQAVYLNGDGTLYQNAWQSLSANGSLGRFFFDGSGELDAHQTTMLDLGITHRLLLTDNFENNASARYRYELDSIDGRTNGVDLRSALAYRIGEVSLLFEVEYELLDLRNSSDGTLAAWLKLRRGIPIIGGREN